MHEVTIRNFQQNFTLVLVECFRFLIDDLPSLAFQGLKKFVVNFSRVGNQVSEDNSKVENTSSCQRDAY